MKLDKRTLTAHDKATLEKLLAYAKESIAKQRRSAKWTWQETGDLVVVGECDESDGRPVEYRALRVLGVVSVTSRNEGNRNAN